MAQVRVQEEVLAPAGVPVIVRRVRARGSNVAIGRALAELAIARYGLRPDALLADVRYVRARRTYFRRNYPIQLERMRGVAVALGLRLDDDRFDFSMLRTRPGESAADVLGAVATYVPPWASGIGPGLLRRSARLPDAASDKRDLYVMEWHPSGAAHPSIALHAYDLLSGTLAGINKAGLVVAAVAAGGDPMSIEHQLGFANAIGLHELQLMRFLLDTCTTVDDAQAALLGVREFTLITSTRYLVADRNGRSFAYEPGLTAQRILDGALECQVIGSSGALSLAGIEAASTDAPPAADDAAPVDAADQSDGWWDCVADQERRSLAVRFRDPATGSVREVGAQL